ncbi:hypothetical protein ACJRO7_027505 [Eucalyptus globulus]|uniref:TIR domain-containing protein n=1 Tax=Eucalyptus globulus TaxID=34317 RepID=A0ABD3JTY5_EUCGL
MVNSETGTSTSNPSGGEYQVFLNFRGPDTRRTFTDILHQALVNAGISVFIDDEGLRPGERISGNLLQAIDNSKLYIPIFSKDYASSHWCLDELAKMVENTSKYKEDGKEKVILPIFYDVKPDDVKLKTLLYKDAISNLAQKMEDRKNKFSSEVIKTWQQALEEVGCTKGWELEKYSGYAELIQAVVHEVVVRLETRQKHVTEHLVGMEGRIATITDLLDIDSNDVWFIGIYGMGGIGKTTLAKIIFNQLLHHFGRNRSFLDDVRETAKTKGLVELQKKLLFDVCYFGEAPSITDIDHGINMIEETICNNKMLIVLDDVDEAKQIQKLIGEKTLYSGTRILVTTRDKSVFNIRGFKYKFKEHEMMRLSDEDALKIFSRHAFNDNSPLPNYFTLSKAIVSTTDGLPLALEAIGSMLFNFKENEIWEETLEKLRETPHQDVLGKLKISYDALNPEQQQIFLDVACMFIGKNKTNPMYVWKDCKFCPQLAIQVLSQRCMIKVLDDKFQMHDQFRDLGRAIAKNERTRLWDEDDIVRELRSTEIKESVQALYLPWSYFHPRRTHPHRTVTSEQIKRFPRMRFLWLPNVTYQGDFTGCLSELKWIDLHCPFVQRLEATNLLHLENVVVANLSGIEITKDLLDSLIKGSRKLTVLTIQMNPLISETPTFPEYSNLKKLTISQVRSLMEIDCSIGKLRWLTDLSFEDCSSIKKLPEQIGELQNLQCLCLHRCFSLIELPTSVSKIKSLMELDVSCTKIAEMPSTMSKLHQLQTLDLDGCHEIQELPKLPISLTTLRLRSKSLQIVPNLSYLTNLVQLLLSGDYRYKHPSNEFQTGDLGWIGSLTKLSNLHVCFTNVRAPTTELVSLSLLKELTLYGLDLPTFKHLSSNLIVLELYETRGKQVHLDGLPPSEKETPSLPTSLGKSKENKVSEQLDFQSLDFLESSERSHIQDCRFSESLACQSEELGCSGLQDPKLIDHWRGAILFPSSQKMLVKFLLSELPEVRDIQFVTAFESLKIFSVRDCFSLKSLGGLSNSKNLERLEIRRCPGLQVVEGIDELEFLGNLEISECRSVGWILDPLSSKIPDNCLILITGSGELPDCRTAPCELKFDRWKSYREKILNGAKQAWSSETKTADSKIETGDSLQKTMKESVQALYLRTTSSNPTTITAEQLRRFPRDFTGCLPKLKWIILMGKTGYSGELDSQTNLGLENVVVMNICSSDLSKDEISYLIKTTEIVLCQSITHTNCRTAQYNEQIASPPNIELGILS